MKKLTAPLLIVAALAAVSGCVPSVGDDVARNNFPPAPATLSAVTSAACLSIDLTWTPSTDPTVTSYNVYWSLTTGVTPANGTGPISVSAASLTLPYHLNTGIPTNFPTLIYAIVTAVNPFGEGAASPEASALTPNCS